MHRDDPRPMMLRYVNGWAGGFAFVGLGIVTALLLLTDVPGDILLALYFAMVILGTAVGLVLGLRALRRNR